MFQIFALYLYFEGAKNIHVLQILIWRFGGHWRLLTGVLNPDIDLDRGIGLGTTIFQILALCLPFEGVKNIHVLEVLIWGFGGDWRFLTGVCHLYLDLDMVPAL